MWKPILNSPSHHYHLLAMKIHNLMMQSSSSSSSSSNTSGSSSSSSSGGVIPRYQVKLEIAVSPSQPYPYHSLYTSEPTKDYMNQPGNSMYVHVPIQDVLIIDLSRLFVTPELLQELTQDPTGEMQNEMHYRNGKYNHIGSIREDNAKSWKSYAFQRFTKEYLKKEDYDEKQVIPDDDIRFVPFMKRLELYQEITKPASTVQSMLITPSKLKEALCHHQDDGNKLPSVALLHQWEREFYHVSIYDNNHTGSRGDTIVIRGVKYDGIKYDASLDDLRNLYREVVTSRMPSLHHFYHMMRGYQRWVIKKFTKNGRFTTEEAIDLSLVGLMELMGQIFIDYASKNQVNASDDLKDKLYTGFTTHLYECGLAETILTTHYQDLLDFPSMLFDQEVKHGGQSSGQDEQSSYKRSRFNSDGDDMKRVETITRRMELIVHDKQYKYIASQFTQQWIKNHADSLLNSQEARASMQKWIKNRVDSLLKSKEELVFAQEWLKNYASKNPSDDPI